MKMKVYFLRYVHFPFIHDIFRKRSSKVIVNQEIPLKPYYRESWDQKVGT